MASGFSRFAKANSAHSLGSFIDIASAASSEFEPVDLEDLELAPSAEMSGRQEEIVMGKNATPAASIHSTSAASTSADQFDEDDQGSVRQLSDPLHEGLQNLEQATQKAAEAAKDFTSKLWVSGTTEAKSSVMRLAGDVSNWWAALDPGTTSEQDKPQNSARSAQGNEEVQELFLLGPTEELMEKFSCTLIQTVKCTHNSFSEPQQVRSTGKLYITDNHTCFIAEGVKFIIPHGEVKTPCKNTGNKGPSLQLKLKNQGEYVCWEDFKGSELDSALGLLEHLTA